MSRAGDMLPRGLCLLRERGDDDNGDDRDGDGDRGERSERSSENLSHDNDAAAAGVIAATVTPSTFTVKPPKQSSKPSEPADAFDKALGFISLSPKEHEQRRPSPPQNPPAALR